MERSYRTCTKTVYLPEENAPILSASDSSSTVTTDPSREAGELHRQGVVYLSPADERANVLTHAAGFVLSLVAAIYFFRLVGNERIGLGISCLVFCGAMACVYLCSTLSHAITDPAGRNRMRAWDQGTIYLLIVGTYTPFIWQGSAGAWRILFLLIVWLAACFGFYSKVLAKHRINSISTVSYLALGWLPAIPLFGTTPVICFVWMLLGGVSYSVGVLFLRMSARVKYSHAVWHMMVMLGSGCHCYAIYKLVTLAD